MIAHHGLVFLMLTASTASGATGDFSMRDVANLAVAVLMLGWFAVRVEKRLDALAASNDRLGTAVLNLVNEIKEARSDIREVREDTGKHIIPPELRGRSETRPTRADRPKKEPSAGEAR